MICFRALFGSPDWAEILNFFNSQPNIYWPKGSWLKMNQKRIQQKFFVGN